VLKPVVGRKTAKPAAVATPAQTGEVVVASSPSRTAPTPPSLTSTLQPLTPATVNAQPSLVPVSAPAAQPSKGAEKLVGLTARAKEQVAPGPAAKPAAADPPARAAQTTVTYVPHNAGIGIIIKGPPRQPRNPWSHTGVLLYVGLGFGTVAVALVFHAKRRRSLPAGPKISNDGLRMPGDFKTKDSAIHPDAPLGMLAPAKPTRRSVVELLSSALLLAKHVAGFLAARLPAGRLTEMLRALWLQVASLKAPATSPPNLERQPREVPPPGDPKTSSHNVSPATSTTPAGASAANPVEGKPMEKPPAAATASSSVPADKHVETPAPQPAPAGKSIAEDAPAPAEQRADTPVSVS
jgi:hypothetical protein